MDAVTLALPILIALITVALAFDFLNGLHDAANSIATIVSTRVLRPQHAVIGLGHAGIEPTSRHRFLRS